jgi:adenylosuccinate lyase
VDDQMPFMATERWLMLGVEAGGDRQALHEVIRASSLATAEAVSRGEPNNLLERLAADHTFARMPTATLRNELDPARYTGRSAEQVDDFLSEYLAPLVARAKGLAVPVAAMEISV